MWKESNIVGNSCQVGDITCRYSSSNIWYTLQSTGQLNDPWVGPKGPINSKKRHGGKFERGDITAAAPLSHFASHSIHSLTEGNFKQLAPPGTSSHRPINVCSLCLASPLQGSCRPSPSHAGNGRRGVSQALGPMGPPDASGGYAVRYGGRVCQIKTHPTQIRMIYWLITHITLRITDIEIQS